jgi:hypothetical protein
MSIISFITKANAIRQVLRDPRHAGQEAVWGIIQGYLFVALGWVALPLLIFASLGFSKIFGGPYELFEILFYLTLAFIVILIILAWLAYRQIKRYWHQLKSRFQQEIATETETVEVVRLVD